MEKCSEFETRLLNAFMLDLEDIVRPVLEWNDHENEVFIKFMSEDGSRDKEQGDLFAEWANRNNVPFTPMGERSFIAVDYKLSDALDHLEEY